MAEKPTQQPEGPPGDGKLREEHPPPSGTPPPSQPKQKSPRPIEKPPPPLQPQPRPPLSRDGSPGGSHPPLSDAPPPSQASKPSKRPRSPRPIKKPSPPSHPPPQELEMEFIDEPLNAVVPVYNGLQLTWGEHNSPLKRAFTYALCPLTQGINPVKKKVLVTDEVEGDHVRVHELQPTEKLAESVAGYRKNKSTKAVVILNTADGLMLDPAHVEGLESSNFPLVVVSQSDGQELKGILDQQDDVLCDINVESTVDHPTQPQAEQGIAGGVTAPQDNKTSKFSKLRDFMSGSSGGLKHELKKIMFSSSGDTLIPLSMESGKFCMVMSVFHNYERQGKIEQSQVRDALQKINKHMNSIFYTDFPFYIVLAHRLYTRQSMYQCDEFQNFIMECINLVENGTHHEIATTITKFLKMPDFTIMFGDGQANWSVFQLLELGFIEMCKISLSSRQKAQRTSAELHDHFIYNTMIWVSLALKVRCQRGSVTRSTATVWNTHLISRSHQLSMNEIQIDCLKVGLKFGKAIDLPKDLMLTTRQMCDMLIGRDSVRKFTSLRYFFQELKSYIVNEEFVVVLTDLRCPYDDLLLKQKQPQKYKQLSKKGTLAGTLEEGLDFLNLVVDIWTRRYVSDMDLKAQLHSECLKWLLLLLQLIDVTAPLADIHLRQFLKGKGIVKVFKREIEKAVIATTRDHFSNLPIQQFFPLYNAFRIWPSQFLQEYLHQYRVPNDVKITDGTWKQFLFEVSQRHSGAHAHYFIHDFLESVAKRYEESNRAKVFVLDLLVIKVSKLLAIEPEDEAADADVQSNFKRFLHNFMKRNSLKQALLSDMKLIMDSISEERDEFQGLVLAVLQKEVVPEFKILRGEQSLSDPTVKDILTKSVTELCRNLNWLTTLSPKQGFHWGIVATFSSKIPVTADSFNWIQDYDYLINQLCHIYKSYCNGQGIRGQEEKLLQDQLPLTITHYNDIRTYFEWVRQVQNVVLTWQRKVLTNELNYDNILLYALFQNGIEPIGHAIGAISTVIEPHVISEQKNSFLQLFEQLNVLLLRYIPGKPEVKWCTLSEVLADNGVSFPEELHDTLRKYVLYPGDTKELVGGLMEQEIPHNTTGQFNAGHDISLKLSRRVRLRDLEKLVTDLQGFLEPILDRMDMLVFFRLHHSVMFDMYQKLFLEKEVKKHLEKVNPISTLSSFAFSIPQPIVSMEKGADKESGEGTKLPILVRSLDKTKELLIKLIEGNATYSEIIAEGRLELENLDIDEEFTTLDDFIYYLKHTLKSKEGLIGVRNMLELFQYTKHIEKIHDVCVQYKLQGCLDDPTLKQLVEIAKELGPEKSRRALTLNHATERMTEVKCLLFGKALSGKKQPQSHCLKLFEAVSNSAAFYQFIKDKRFTGDRGQAVFSQQYQLITAQLQHEEYDEHVLNHLFAAFKFMSPFMNTHQDFKSLMGQVIELDTSHGLKQLETVNSNITMIQLWFSRAEGDTLQNVANELESIINTGVYIFTLSSGASGGEAGMMLEYVPSAQHVIPPISHVDDGGPPTFLRSGSYTESGLHVGNGTHVVSRKENWNKEQINDFVRKLGFLDTQREGGDQIKHFLHINEVANKLLNLHVHLKDLGHPKYLRSCVTRYLECKTNSEQADGEVTDTENQLTMWAKSVTKLRSQNEWLLFFSVPKQLLLYQLIQECNEEELVYLLLKEVMFLVSNDPETREQLSEDIKACMPHWSNISESYNAMEIVGGFLGDLLQNHTLPRRSTKVFRRPSYATQFPGVSEANQFLHHAPKYTQSQLVRLIVSIYGGVPESFEVFHCRSSSTKAELSLFLERIERKPLRYLILEVNKLPFGLQEYLMQCYLKIQQQARLQAEREHVQSAEHEIFTREREELPRSKNVFPTIHFVETASSVLRELPWILPKEHKEGGPSLTFDGAQKQCKETVKDFAQIQLVYGKAGDGKTHYIKKQLQQSSHSLTIAVNEAFTPLSAIKKLRTLHPNQSDCAIFLNFTMLPPGESVDESEDQNYKELMKVIGWFFFDLFLLGYVEDPITGLSFSIPGGMGWKVFVEVPSRISSGSPEESLAQFIREVPALGMLGVPYAINPNTPYTVDEDVQLVCKYLKAYRVFMEKGGKGINKIYRETYGKLVKFSEDRDIPPKECHELLQKSWPQFVENPKVTQRLFIKYMKRRCAFLDKCPAFNYNTGHGEYFEDASGKKMASDTRQLGSTLMSTMLQEVEDFCDPKIKGNWSLKPHQQLIYDFRDGGGSFGLLSLRPEHLPDKDKTKFERIGVKIPSMVDLYSRDMLDDYLSRALSIELEDKRLALVDKSDYVLTLDYTIKMLNIHERYECGVPVIIEGETGVGKTALVEMLSKLWNQSLLNQWRRQKDQILDFMRRKLGDLTVDETMDDYMRSVKCVEEISAGKPVKEDDLITLCQLPDASSTTRRFYTTLRTHLLKMEDYPVLSLITMKTKTRERRTLNELFTICRETDDAETTASLLHAVMVSEIRSTFYKINVHAALTPEQIWGYLKPAIDQANTLKEAYKGAVGQGMSLHLPFVTVFLDEVNTSSCLGLFKEIILDRTFDGVPMPENVFIVAACNPHRGNSLAAHTSKSLTARNGRAVKSMKENWTRSTYYVRQLHPTLDFLKWDYGSLDEQQEREYVSAKMKMLNKEMAAIDIEVLTDLIVDCQRLMREYARQQLSLTMSPDEAQVSSRSCVSQRDIQRVFTFFEWFRDLYNKFRQHGERNDYSRRAILVSLGIVYYMRLNTRYRNEFKKYLDGRRCLPGEVIFSVAFQQELQWCIQQVELPTGIARTQALMENLFATIVCTGTHTPLIIVGAPGSSKTLSFNLAIANLKGQESKVKIFRFTDIFHSLDPHFYQCSRRTTSNEIDTVFSRAINRQRSHSRFSLPIYCVVFMDEAGLPEESHESLKVLHYHLDRQEVSFVAITNHMLDAAKSNRAVCLFRPEASEEDLKTLARGCLSSKLDSPPPELQKDLELVVKFCPAFSKLMEQDKFNYFFGLRDFIHFVNYLRRKRGQMLNPQIVMESLERNFNGHEEFEQIAKLFLCWMGSKYENVQKRSILTVLKDSLRDRPSQDGQDMSENEVRYKLIIDPSEDDSLIRLLFSLGVLDRQNTRMYVCSDFPGDSQIQKINTIAAIRHSAIEGHTVVMSQTDDIHESFYDLFNQRFRRIDDPQQGSRYYTNIAIGAHLRPCRVHPNFQCVVVVKSSEVKDTPAPFLNRFEKYCITHSTLLETALTPLPPCLKRVILAAKDKVEEFVESVGADGLYGIKWDTVNSLILSLLPPMDFEFQCLKERGLIDVCDDIKVHILRLLIQCLRRCCGLYIPYVSPDELVADAEHLFSIVMCDAEFVGVMKRLDHHQATDAVYEAVKMLQTAPTPPPKPDDEAERIQYLDLSSEGCLVVMLFQQWLVHHLTKRMMQLMTSEAFIERRSKIPSSYLENYLAFQTHFSLSNLINKYLSGLDKKWEPTFPTSKILCFTRSSQLIHQLPAQYPSAAFERQNKEDVKQTLKDLVHEDVEKLMVCKLSNVPSQSHVLDLLRSFVNSDTAEVLLLVVNMHEIKQQVMNHMRIMIEEEETLLLKEDRQQKLFLLLLHFPPSKFNNACYPSLFLRGWDHCYLDTIAHSAVKGVVDIRSWFWDCCFPQDALPPPEEDPLIMASKEILNEAIPILASRVFFGFVHNGHFNTSMSGSKRTKILKVLLFEKGLGNVLCDKFRTYWKPSVMSEYLKKTVVFTRSQDSTLNITDSIQTTFKTLFFDFLVYMISRINEDCNIDVLFSTASSPIIQQLFLNIVRVFRIPKLSELKVRSVHLQQGKQVSHLPQFPFFKTVSGEVQRLVEDSREEANTKINLMGDLETNGGEMSITYMYYGVTNHQSFLLQLKEIVVRKVRNIVESEDKSFLAHSLKAMEGNPEIWDYYFSDFISSVLHLEGSDGISQRILRAFFTGLEQEKSIRERLVQLHVYMDVYQLELAKMATVLRPLDRIQHVVKASPNALSPILASPTKELVDIVQQTRHPLGTPEHLSAFVVSHLFSALVGAAYGQAKSPGSQELVSNPENMLEWYKAYRDVMCLPALKQHVYSALNPKADGAMVTVEGRLNVMQTVFLTLQTVSEPSDDLLRTSQKIFQTLFNRYFSEDMELKTSCPRIESVSEVAVEVVADNSQVRLLLEGLFAHFFSSHRPAYHKEDMEWFLELANQQEDWCVPNFVGEVIGGTSELDLLDAVERSITQKERERTASLSVEVPKGAVSMCIFKLYLSRLLGECEHHDQNITESGPLILHQPLPRMQVGLTLLKKPNLGDPGPYIPTFYQECSSIQPEKDTLSDRMQQPLAHLYFLTVLEHILSDEQSLANMVRVAGQLSHLANSRLSEPAHKVVLQIELQAVLQAIAKLLASLLDASDRVQLVGSISEINRLFGDVNTGGGRVGGHGMVVALHLLKKLKSSRKFIELLTTKFEVMCKDIMCLRPLHDQLKQPSESNVHLLPFMLPVGDDELRGLYQKVKTAMFGVHQRNSSKELERIATECNSARRMSGITDRSPAGKNINNHCNFKMMMWLVIFYEFYDKKLPSTILCEFIGTDDFVELAKLREEEIRLFQCFLDTRLMVCRPENPNPLRADEEVLELVAGGGHRRRKPKVKVKTVDPLHQLFVPDDPKQTDQSDIDLRYALANMIAVVLGCQPQSNHLWYHLFDQQPLWNSYLTGFMYNNKINKDGLLYDCGVELSPEGQFGRQDYLKHANRGTYTLHSLYLILWANFGSFCIALLVQPDADGTIHGPLISDWLSVRHYCVSQLKTVWMHMRNNLGISDEERSFLLMRCMKRLYEVMNYNSNHPESCRGVFTTTDQLDSYEKLWHLCIYKPSRNELREKFTEYSDLRHHAVFINIRSLERHYPYFPTEKDFTHSVLSATDIEQNNIALLSRFALEWRRLQAGGELLPDLVELYQWLHTDLAHIVSYEMACKVKIKSVIDRAVRKYSPDMGEHLRQLFAKVKAGYNHYVELIGGAIGVGACAAVRRGNKIYTIDDDIPLLHFLSDVEEEEEGNDWLFTVIADIITSHNAMVELPKQVASQSFQRLLPNQQAKAYPREIATTSCIIPQFRKIHGVNELLQLLRSRHKSTLHSYPTTSAQKVTMSLSAASSSPLFYLSELQEDIVTSFLSGKPFILEVSNLRTPFKFKATAPRAILHPADAISADELTAIRDNLPGELKAEVQKIFRKRLEFEFHSAGYHVMLETTTGLRTAAGHLVKCAMGDGAVNPQQTLSDFLLSLYDGLNTRKEVLSEIGVRKVNATQLTCLSELPLANLYHCLNIFATWMEDGMYDFATLPYTIKAHLTPEDLAILKAIPLNWEATLSELMDEVRMMNDSLSHIESHITSQDMGHGGTPITVYLRGLHLIADDDKLPRYIPDTVFLQHYVEFRVVLRRIMSEVQHKMEQEAVEQEAAEKEPQQWKEVVEDIWREHLPHFRDDLYVGDGDFIFDAATGQYGFQYENESEGEDDLMGEDEEEVTEGDDEFSMVPEDDQTASAMPSHTSAKDDELSRLMQDPSMKQKLTSYAKILKEESTQRAAKYTKEQVAEFLKSIGLAQYVNSFLEEGVDGESMSEANDEDLDALGVQSQLDKIKIMVLFKRHVVGKPASITVDDVADFLKSQKLDTYIDKFREKGIDGDILSAIVARKEKVQFGGKEIAVVDLVLQEELGVARKHMLKVKGKIKGFCESLTSTRSAMASSGI